MLRKLQFVNGLFISSYCHIRKMLYVDKPFFFGYLLTKGKKINRAYILEIDT